VIALDDIVNGAITSRHHVEAPARAYIATFRRHIDAEEANILPLAAALLDRDDWEAIDGALHKLDDPLFGKPRDERYAALRRRIARDSKARGRPPLTSDARGARVARTDRAASVRAQRPSLHSVGRRVRDALVALVHVIAPARNCSCIGCTKSFCFATISLVNTWQCGNSRNCSPCTPPRPPSPSAAALLELLLGRDDAAHLADRVLDAGLRLVEKERGIAMRDVAIVATGADAVRFECVHALLVLLRDPLHRVARAAAELVGAGLRDHHLRRDHAAGADQRPTMTSASTDQRALGDVSASRIRAEPARRIQVPWPLGLPPFRRRGRESWKL
jgi:hypothetical protein